MLKLQDIVEICNFYNGKIKENCFDSFLCVFMYA